MKIRTQEENHRFTENLESAIDKAWQTIYTITYSSYPQVNKEAIAKIDSAISIMEEVLEMDIFKP